MRPTHKTTTCHGLISGKTCKKILTGLCDKKKKKDMANGCVCRPRDVQTFSCETRPNQTSIHPSVCSFVRSFTISLFDVLDKIHCHNHGQKVDRQLGLGKVNVGHETIRSVEKRGENQSCFESLTPRLFLVLIYSTHAMVACKYKRRVIDCCVG